MNIVERTPATVETTRIVTVVDKNLEPGKAMNAIAYRSVWRTGLASRGEGSEVLGLR